MTREEVLDRVQDVFRDVFYESDLIIEDKTNSNDIKDWDSLNHVNLISAIEKEFKIKFTLGELVTFKDVGVMVNLTQEKLKI